MKKYLVILVFSFISAKALSQTHTLTIYSYANATSCVVQYINYDKLYPDSIKSAVMIDYRKQYQVRNSNTLLLRMNLDGWKLVATVSDASGAFGNVNTFTQFLMSKEISLDDAAMKLYIERLNSLK
ncbi:MAG: hypothetical protein J0I41_00225 [Filimonas sp.]|nr:hypothetical protein [Filimonas sp.]